MSKSKQKRWSVPEQSGAVLTKLKIDQYLAGSTLAGAIITAMINGLDGRDEQRQRELELQATAEGCTVDELVRRIMIESED